MFCIVKCTLTWCVSVCMCTCVYKGEGEMGAEKWELGVDSFFAYEAYSFMRRPSILACFTRVPLNPEK